MCELDLVFLSSSFAAVGNEIGAISDLFFFFFCMKSVICWPSSGSYSDNVIFVLMFLACPKLPIESYWYHFAFYSIPYLYPSLGHYYSCSRVLVLHFCWQLPNLFFGTYWPSAGSPFAAWLSLWHSCLEWMSSNFLELDADKNELKLEELSRCYFLSIFLICHWLWWMHAKSYLLYCKICN